MSPRMAFRVAGAVLLGWTASAAVAWFSYRTSGSPSTALFATALFAPLAGTPLYFVLARPLRRLLHAVRDGIQQLKENDFSFGFSASDASETRLLAEAFNSLVDTLRRQRLDLHQRELLLDTIIQSTPVAMVLTDHSNHVVYANVASRDLFAIPHRLEGMTFRELLQSLPKAAREALPATGDGLITFQRDGQPQVWHVAKRVFMLNARPHRLVLMKQLTRELAAQELDTWKKLIRLIAHELNNSLAPISSLARSGRKLAQRPDPQELDRVLSIIENRADHLASFIEGYAKFARLPRPRPQPIQWEQFLQPLGEALNCRVLITPTTLEGCFDLNQIEQVIINLVKNAHESGSPAEDVEVVVHEQNQGSSVEVRDRGQGLSEEALRNALLPFFSTKASGSGLGLTLCREIAHAHGGHLVVANRPGGGAVVLLWIPCRQLERT